MLFCHTNGIEIENCTINLMPSPDRSGKPAAKNKQFFLGQKEQPKGAPFWT